MVVFVSVEFNGGNAKAVATTLVILFACFVLFAAFLFLSHIFHSPPALCRYLLPRLRVVSSAQRLYVICSSSARMCFLQPFRSSCITFFRMCLGSFVLLVLIFLIFLVWLVVLRSRTRYASISLALP